MIDIVRAPADLKAFDAHGNIHPEFVAFWDRGLDGLRTYRASIRDESE